MNNKKCALLIFKSIAICTLIVGYFVTIIVLFCVIDTGGFSSLGDAIG
jgi:uncharacterized membrane protein